MINKKLLSVLSAILVVSAVLTGCNSNKESVEQQAKAESNTITLTYAFFAPPITFPGRQMQMWKEELEERTNGKVKVELYPAGTLLQANNMFDGVEKGVADIGMSVTSYEPGRFPLMGMADMASYPNSKVATQVRHKLVQEYEEEIFKGNKVITVFTGEPSYIQATKPITSLEDLKGKQLRISGALAPVLEELGAAPVGMSQAEAAESLQMGIIEGVVTSREILKDFNFAELVGYVTDYPLSVNTFVAIMSEDKWNSLPEDVQEEIDKLSLEMAEWTSAYHDDYVQESLEWSINEHGVEVVSLSEEEKERWDEIIVPLMEEYVEKAEDQGLPAREFKQKMYKLIEKYTSE
ncbi:TRAP-type C4-dicarboxylate transport system, substrate-binding protein [Alteribacillus persepolensis]|uniref:TRAP-type C4-dicarboxylate transport system, substrate-binding protein n=1 Tax=Alteribacillus persepolensis TaxID=568899 RepID=A0A1G8J7H8_9BACI|nr:TRAP transporter substrate-binding protein [Alteribacillus persepolensis]SDI27146.1 TRAP-type C4-dicarboxylate transport system, substrate-binding protein [Alteribacillus persepolensis]